MILGLYTEHQKKKAIWVRYTYFMNFIAWWACIFGEVFITHIPQDLIRQTLYGSHYNITFDDSTIRYCLSGLRQSVMCSADTSVLVWQWSDAYNQVMERSDILHSCKNFTKIQEWVRSRYVDIDSLDFTSYHWYVVTGRWTLCHSSLWHPIHFQVSTEHQQVLYRVKLEGRFTKFVIED